MWRNLLIVMAERSPMYLLALVGIVIALSRWRRHPGVSGLTAAAFLLYLFKSVVFAFLFQWLPTLRVSMHLSWNAIDNLSTVLGVLSDVFFGIVLLMLVLAALSKRREVTPTI